MENQIYARFSCIMKKVGFQIGTKQRLSYRHGRHDWGAHNWLRGQIWPGRNHRIRPMNHFFHFYHSSLFTLTQSLLNLHNFSFVAITRFLEGTFGQIWWRGAQKHFNGPGAGASEERMLWVNVDGFASQSAKIYWGWVAWPALDTGAGEWLSREEWKVGKEGSQYEGGGDISRREHFLKRDQLSNLSHFILEYI